MDKLWISPDCQLIMSLGPDTIHPYYKYEDKIEVQKALDIFKWQVISKPQKATNFEDANYRIMTYKEYNEYLTVYHIDYFLRHISNKYYIVFLSEDEYSDAMMITEDREYTWRWKYDTKHPGYEVTSRGDRRFSPFFQYIDYNGTLISTENYYKQVIAPTKENGTYVPGTGHKLIYDYLNNYKGLIFELALIGIRFSFTDMFDKSGGQNKWYAEFLNDYINEKYPV